MSGSEELVPSELARWAGLPGPRAVLAAARDRIEGGFRDRAVLTVALDSVQRHQVGRLFGMTWAKSQRPVTLGQLRGALERDGASLDALLTSLGGPLRDLRAERAADAAALTGEVDRLRARLIAVGLSVPVVDLAVSRRWFGPPGTPTSMRRLDGATAVFGVLPTQGVLLAELGSQLFGDPHALDRSAELGRLVSRLLGARAAFADAGAVVETEALARAADEAVSRADRWRAEWSAVGVACDRVSSTVLVLNVRLFGAAAAAGLANAVPGEPVWLTARALAGPWTAGAATATTVVRVCENPAVVEAAADRLGVRSAPLVCTFGRPSGAAWALLDGLAAAGVQMLVTGDRDLAGRQITDALLSRLAGSAPWLPDVPGTYEEDRLAQLVADCSTGSAVG